MAAVAARIQEEDPIQEDETDVVVARMNIRKPWPRASSPPRRLQASSKTQNNKLSQANSLPPHLRGSASYTITGNPIVLQRPETELELGGGLVNNMRSNNSANFGAFRPHNSLSRRTAGQSRPQTTNSRHSSNTAARIYSNRKRSHNEVVAVEDEEDELAGPGIRDRNSSSPTKRRRVSITRESSVEEYQRVERVISPPKGLSPSRNARISRSIDLSSLYGETEKQKRERKRQQTVLKREQSQRQHSELTSPYFSVDAQDRPKEPVSSPPRLHISPNHSTEASPTTMAKNLQKYLDPHDSFLAELNQSSMKTEDQATKSLLTPKNRSPKGAVQQHKESPRHELLRRHEKHWSIKGFFTERHSHEHGLVQLIVDKTTKMLSVRVDDTPQSERFPMSKIYEAKFSESLIRLHFRGPPATMIWIRTRKDAEKLLIELQEIHRFPKKIEKRAEQMFAKWIYECDNRSSSPVKKMSEDIPVTPLRPSTRDQVSTLAHRRPAFPEQDSVKVEQDEDTPKPKRLKLNERLQASETKPHKGSTVLTLARNSIKEATTVIDLPSTGSKRSLRRSEGSQTSDVTYDTADLSKSSRKDITTNSEHYSRLPLQPMELPCEEKDPVTNAPKHDLPRTTRLTRSSHTKRSYTDHNKPEAPAVAKYSETHGLGLRWTEPLIWPRSGKKRVTVEFDDLPRLDEGELLNDSLVEFALQWLRHEIDDPPNIYWFNTYFFEKISKGKGRQIDYNGVKKWTKDVDLFSYDYVVVPINENYHWYLAIICNLPRLKYDSEVKKAESTSKPVTENAEKLGGLDESADLELLTRSITLASPRTPIYSDKLVLDEAAAVLRNSHTSGNPPKPKVSSGSRGRVRDPLAPTIATLDSLGAPHPEAIATLKLYLKEEAQERLGVSWKKDDIVGMTAKGIPCQNNLSDCGLYLLGYVGMMLQNPTEFKSKLLLKEFDTRKDWDFCKPSALRTKLREAIQNRHRSQMRRAARTSRGKIAVDGCSSDTSSDDIQLLGPANPIIETIHRSSPIASIFPSSKPEEQYPEAISTTDNVPDESSSEVQTNLAQMKSESPKQVTVRREATPASDAHPVSVKTHQELTDIQQSFEVPETPQSSPLSELPTRPSTPDVSVLDQIDQSLVAQSTPLAFSFSSKLRSFFGQS